ncbi:MAG TPA: transposase [Anaerolineales bacterium]|nr:transposase [Anaerolineales bacterium]
MKKSYRIEGSIFYITSNIYSRLQIFTRPSFIIPIIDSLNYYRYQYASNIIGYVIMPDHLHLLLWPQNAKIVTDFMRDFKRFTSGRITRQSKVEGKTEWLKLFEQNGSITDRAEYKVWQDSFWEQCIYTEDFLRQKLNYIHLNPVRAGIVKHASEYPYSSYRNYYMGDRHLIEIDNNWY